MDSNLGSKKSSQQGIELCPEEDYFNVLTDPSSLPEILEDCPWIMMNGTSYYPGLIFKRVDDP